MDVIRRQFPGTVIGIANGMGYYDSFQRNGLFTILVEHGQSGGAARIEGGVVVRDWLHVRELYTRNPGLKDPAVARALASNGADDVEPVLDVEANHLRISIARPGGDPAEAV